MHDPPRITTGDVYDLAGEYFTVMPGWFPAGDARYSFWMTHTPKGNVVADPMKVGKTMNEHVSYTGSAFSMDTHTGTHIDALNHFGFNGKVSNEFSVDEHLGDHGWTKTGTETIPPIVARGVLTDVAAYKGVHAPSAGHRIEQKNIVGAFGGDNLSLQAFPCEVEVNHIPVHTFLLAQHGIPIMELVELEGVPKDNVYEFAFIGGSLKLRGADAVPMRPIAIPMH